MFADPDFATFSQEVGLASLGATDEDISRLAHCYWHTVEFGLVRENGELKAYGAGVLSSFGEMQNACVDPDRNDAPQYLKWDPVVASKTSYPITTYQPTYFVADSLADAKDRLIEFSETLTKPFYARYNPLTSTVWVDRAVKRGENKLRENKVSYGN
jgi:phenylalanine-4-hydroxylase